MKRNILYTGLIAATTLLTFGSCYDLDEMNRDPYGVEDDSYSGDNDEEDIILDKPVNVRYANIDLNYHVKDSAAYKKQLADAPAKFRKFLYEGYYNDYQRTTNLSHDIYAGYVANNQPKHAGKAPDYNYTDGWSALRWSFFYNDRSSEYRDLVRAYKFNETPEKYRNMFYITRIYYASSLLPTPILTAICRSQSMLRPGYPKRTTLHTTLRRRCTMRCSSCSSRL